MRYDSLYWGFYIISSIKSLKVENRYTCGVSTFKWTMHIIHIAFLWLVESLQCCVPCILCWPECIRVKSRRLCYCLLRRPNIFDKWRSRSVLRKAFYICTPYRVRQNYGIQGLMEHYKFNSLSAINLTRG